MPLIEIVANSSRSEKPGWAYVPDTGFDPTKAPLQPGTRKRNVRLPDGGEAGLSARQNLALAKKIADLEKDNHRDLAVPLPIRPRAKPKTATTKKILESQRSLSHYVADEEASLHIEAEPLQAKTRIMRLKTVNVMSLSDKDQATTNDARSRQAPVLSRGREIGAASVDHAPPTDEATLLRVSSPRKPSVEVMQRLVSTSPLSWPDVRARPPTGEHSTRHFCELCGYWGRVRCMQCGARLCGLNCKRAHDEGRCQKYGG